jgi:hypothetical protein
VTLDGEKLHDAPLGRPEHDNATAELNAPPRGLTLIVNFTDCPCFTAAEFGLAEIEKSTPVPVRTTVCGLPDALSGMLRDPDCIPPAVGRKLIEIVHVAVGASEYGQLLPWTKGPEMLIPEMVNAALPVLVIVIVCAALVVPTSCAAKLKLAGDNEREGCAVKP